MIVLGISAFVHDSAACLVKDGELVANVEEERLNRIKHTDAFPINAIDFVLAQGGVHLADVDVIAYNWHPVKAAVAELIKLAIAPVMYFQILRNAKPPKNFRSIIASLRLRSAIDRNFPGQFRGKIVWVEHHLAHAASSYYLSPFNRQDADIVVVDGHGEDCSTSVFAMKDGAFQPKWKAPAWDSLGILYTTFTNFLGFDLYEEGKTMALASFGRDTFRDAFRRIIAVRSEGRYTLLNKKYLGLWNFSETGLGKEFGSKRHRDEPLEQRHYDIACSMQIRVKETILHVVRHAQTTSGNRNLCLSGGVFLNCDINGEILQKSGHDRVFIPPFPSDSGGAAGAALYAAHVHGKIPPAEYPNFSPYLGPSFEPEEILRVLEERDVKFSLPADPYREAAQLLAKNKVIGWFQGRMESGPRALGNRSMLASPLWGGMQEYLNVQVKKRETFRPFAPVVTREAAFKYFELHEPLPELTRYMLMTTHVREEYREKLPGITHVDGTSRIQVVTEESNARMHRLLKEFEKATGYAVLINTSFNKQEPIVCTPEDALNAFESAGLDALFIGEYRVDR